MSKIITGAKAKLKVGGKEVKFERVGYTYDRDGELVEEIRVIPSVRTKPMESFIIPSDVRTKPMESFITKHQEKQSREAKEFMEALERL